ncbi:MAG: sporulation protein [Clostridiales bacterium]|nr:sporulation protein [Clostridiales bacterium]
MSITTDKATNATVRTPHTIQIDRRRRTVITGVMDVCSFHETEIIMKLESGHLFVTGQGLHIGKLLPDENRLDIDGQVDSLVYETPRKVSVHWWPWRRKQG